VQRETIGGSSGLHTFPARLTMENSRASPEPPGRRRASRTRTPGRLTRTYRAISGRRRQSNVCQYRESRNYPLRSGA
jgi:hypothetical protein